MRFIFFNNQNLLNSKVISTFHYITHNVEGFTHSELAKLACKGGADWVQLRVKDLAYNEWEEIAINVKKICQKYNAKLIINDNVKIAKAINAAGVHLGKNDLNHVKARKILGDNFIIGGTANTFDDIIRLYKTGVDYIGLGPYRFSSTKENLSHVLGLNGYKDIMRMCVREKVDIPIIAIGGIMLKDVEKLIKTGIYGIAVSSAINITKNKAELVNKFIDKLESLNE